MIVLRCLYNDSEVNGVSSKSVHGVVDSRWISDVTPSSSSVLVWNHLEDSASWWWRAAAAAPGLAHRLLSPPPEHQPTHVDEDSDVVDRVTLPRVARRSSATQPAISPSSTSYVRAYMCLLSWDFVISVLYCVPQQLAYITGVLGTGSCGPSVRRVISAQDL